MAGRYNEMVGEREEKSVKEEGDKKFIHTAALFFVLLWLSLGISCSRVLLKGSWLTLETILKP